jgi:hypothetical protein
MPLRESNARNPPFLICYCKRVKFTTTVVHRKARAQLGTGSTLCKVAGSTFRSGVSFGSTSTGGDCPQADIRQRLLSQKRRRVSALPWDLQSARHYWHVASGGEWEMLLNPPRHLSGSMSQLGQSRHFRDVGDESGSPLETDLIGSIG